jgi:amino acid transporter
MSAGAVISRTGNNMGAFLAGSRMLFALAESGDIPRVFARIHLRYRTPSNAIIFTALVTLAFALSGSFTVLAIASALGRLVIYLSVCAATLRLRQPASGTPVLPATFIIPLGPTVPILATAISLLMIAGANRVQFLGGGSRACDRRSALPRQQALCPPAARCKSRGEFDLIRTAILQIRPINGAMSQSPSHSMD